MHSELSSPSGVSSIFSPFLDLGSPTSILTDFLSSRTASPNLENSWVQISRDESFSPPFDWGSRHAAPDSVIVPPLGASFYETGDAIETGDSDCTDAEDEGDCSKDAAVEEALRASLATLLATRNLSRLETETRTSASSPKSTVVGTEGGCYSSAVHACPSNHSIQAAPLSRADVPIDRKPTVITPGSGGGELRYKYAPPTSPFNLSVQGMNATRAPHHSRLSAQKNSPTFLDKPCLLCSLHLCRKQVSNQHRTISSSPPSPKLQCFPARKSASCPTTPPPTPLLIPRKKKDPPCPSSRCTLIPGEIVHASRRTLKGRESFHRAAGFENPNVKGNEAIIGPSDANDKNRGDSNGDCPEGIIAWITRMWLNAGLKIKVLSAIALSAMFLGTGLSARSYFHRIRINTAVYTTSVLRL